MKSEPDVYGISDLERDGTTPWEGVRNYQARNLMRDQMRVGDEVLFYHSNAQPPGVAGLARVSSEAYPDATQFKEGHMYQDPTAKEEAPRWWLVDVTFVSRFPRFVNLAELKNDSVLTKMLVCRRGQRLSVQPVEKRHFQRVVKLASRSE